MMKSIVALLLCVAPFALAADSSDPWPKTKAGRMARGWVEAFSAGETEMQKFTAANISEEQLRKRPLEDRMATYRTNRLRFGTLKLASVKRSTESEIDVMLLADDNEQHQYMFVVQLKAPFKLVSVKMLDHATMESGHMHGH